jgi:hypothetical protein
VSCKCSTIFSNRSWEILTSNITYRGWVIGFISPYMINPDAGNLGAKVGFVFFGLGIPLCVAFYLFMPETKGLTFEDVRQAALLLDPVRECRPLTARTCFLSPYKSLVECVSGTWLTDPSRSITSLPPGYHRATSSLRGSSGTRGWLPEMLGGAATAAGKKLPMNLSRAEADV